MSLIENVRATLHKHKMVEGFNTVYVGFSGGADSTALLFALREISVTENFSVKAVHVNHNLRGEESIRDEKFCEEFCRKFEIPLEIHNVDVKKYSIKHKKSIELSARELRYEIFENISADAVIATAHNMNDLSETVIFNLSRGTGTGGLLGIPPVRGRIIRPLLGVSREEILLFLNDKNQNFVTDSTNLCTDYTRNKIRHDVIPKLCEINENLHKNVLKMTENLRNEDDFLNLIVEKNLSSDLRKLHSAIRRRVIKEILSQNNIEISYDRILDIEKLILSENKGKINLSGEIYCVTENGIMKIISLKKSCENIVFEKDACIGINEFLQGKNIKIQTLDMVEFEKDSNVNKKLTKNVADYDTIQGKLVLRNRRNGDKYAIIGRDFTSSLKKLFCEHIARENRDFIAIICDDIGIVWTETFGIAERVRVTEKTKTILKFEVE